jgi:hypothetical protein
MSSVGRWVLCLVIGGIVSALALHAVLFGPAMRKEAARLRAEEIDREDRVLCQKLGMPHGTDGFAACAKVLSQARQNEATRVANDTVGIL